MWSKFKRWLKNNWTNLAILVIVLICISGVLYIREYKIANNIPLTESVLQKVDEDSLSKGSSLIQDTDKTEEVKDKGSESKKQVSEPKDSKDNKQITVTMSIDCKTILDNIDSLNEGLEKYVGDGVILSTTKVKANKGDTVYDVLVKTCKNNNINIESTYTPGYGTAYIESINNLREFDCGDLSGWTYKVNGVIPSYGCSKYVLKSGDSIEWRYTCNLGNDV